MYVFNTDTPLHISLAYRNKLYDVNFAEAGMPDVMVLSLFIKNGKYCKTYYAGEPPFYIK